MNKPRNLETIAPGLRIDSSELSGSSISTSTLVPENVLDVPTVLRHSSQKIETVAPRAREEFLEAPVDPDRSPFDFSGPRQKPKTDGDVNSIVTEPDNEDPIGKTLKRGLIASAPGWLISCLFHLAVLLVLALTVAVGEMALPPIEIELVRANAAIEPMMDIEMELDASMESMTIEPELESLSAEADMELTDVIHETGTISINEFEGLGDGDFESYAEGDWDGESGAGAGNEPGTAMEEGTGTEFFGAEAFGNKFVFVIDCSGSMMYDNRWRRLIEEMIQSVNVLGEEQEICVLLYNNLTYPMLDIAPRDLRMIPVSEQFKREFYDWLSFQRPAGGTTPAHAMSIALRMQPDAIFLLSDGILSDNTQGMLRLENKLRDWPDREDVSQRKTPVHCITLGPEAAGARLMEQIARENEGSFRWVK